jgi:hypothetical protein
LAKIDRGDDNKILYAHMKREYGIDVEKAHKILSEMEEKIKADLINPSSEDEVI